jgi:hypothetical protein
MDTMDTTDTTDRHKYAADYADESQFTIVVALLLVVLLIALFIPIRYAGNWAADGDTTVFTRAIQQVVKSGSLVPPEGLVYPSGYSYQAFILFFTNLTGISVANMQTIGSLLLITWIIFPAWLLYRELSGTSGGAVLGVLLLLMQPEFLYGIMRGTHEKFSRGLFLLCIYLLIRSLRSQNRPLHFASLVLTFYLLVYTMISFNNLMATSFVVAMSIAMLLSGVIMRENMFQLRVPEHIRPLMKRLTLTTMSGLLLSFIFIFYIYEPARNNLLLMQDTGDQVASLVLDVETRSVNPYLRQINRAWINPHIYFLLIIPNLVVLLGSASIWAWKTIRWFLLGHRPQDQNELLLWAFYTAFAVQGAMSILIDFSGAIVSNLQHRLFPAFAMLGIGLIARALIHMPQPANLLLRKLQHTALALGIGLLIIPTLLKATNEPFVGNHWLFFLPGEMIAIEWVDEHLQGRTVWLGFSTRLEVGHTTYTGATRQRQFTADRGSPPLERTRDLFISTLLQSRAQRAGVPLPKDFDDFVTYDNGQVQIYHRRPNTLYQR